MLFSRLLILFTVDEMISESRNEMKNDVVTRIIIINKREIVA